MYGDIWQVGIRMTARYADAWSKTTTDSK